MFSTYYILEKSVIDSIENENFSDALDSISQFVTAVRYSEQAPGQLIGSRRLDALCERIGECFFELNKDVLYAARPGEKQPEDIVVLCTGLYRYGGTSLVIEDIIKAHKSTKCTVLVTNLLNDMSREDLNARNFIENTGVVETAPSGASADKLKWVMQRLFSISPKRIFLLNHFQDSVIISSVQPFVCSAKVVFYHHADHNLCLGVHLKNVSHVDPHNVGFYNCRTNEGLVNNYYLPMLVDDRESGIRAEDFLLNESLTTCSSGTFHKFSNFYLYSYADLICERLATRGGRHIHIGDIPESYRLYIEKTLQDKQVDLVRFEHIPWVPNLWDTLVANRIDLFIGSFPIGGARTLIEVMGVGLPILMHENYLSRFHSSRDIAYPDAFVWKYPEEFISIIEGITKDLLQTHSIKSREHYLKYYSSNVISFSSAVDQICAGIEPIQPYPTYTYHPDNLDRTLHFNHLRYLIESKIEQQFLRSNTWRLGYLFRTAAKFLRNSKQIVWSIIYSIKIDNENINEKTDPLNIRRIAMFASLAYSGSGKLDHYLNALATQFKELGFILDIYAAHDYTKNASMYGLNDHVDYIKLNTEIAVKNYEMVLSINNALLTEKLNFLSKIPVVDLIIDDFNHLFNLDNCSVYEQFNISSHILFSSYSHIKRLKEKNPIIAEKIYFFPTATTVENRLAGQLILSKKYNISWIASLVDVSGISLVFHLCVGSWDKIELLQYAIQCFKDGNLIQYNKRIGRYTLNEMIREYTWTTPYFEMQVQNLISNESRISIANDLRKFGLHIFGNREWLSVAAYHPNIMDVYHDGSKIESHSDIMRVYNSSKICINVPQVQTESALPFRVIDILASDALLITKYHPNSDAFTIFGTDCPIVMYKDNDELVRLVDYYLTHDDKRLALVKKCNELVKNGFDFKDRCKDILNVAGVSWDGGTINIGSLNYISSAQFMRFGSRIKVRFRSSTRLMLKYSLKVIPFALRRSLLANLRDF